MKIHRQLTFIAIFALCTCFAVAQSKNKSSKLSPIDSQKNNALKLSQKAEDINTQFSNLPEEKRLEYFKLRANAHRYFSNKRTFEALLATCNAKAIIEGDPAVHNLQGAIFVEFRDFKKAREAFNIASKIVTNDTNILFNIAEMDFCDNNWKRALEQFEKIIQILGPDSNSSVVKISEFKIMLCKLALSKDAEPTTSDQEKKSYLEEAKVLAKKYSFLVDSPYYYYANAALAFYDNDNTKASEWLIKARAIFSNNPGLISAWDDTLIEFGYIEAHYGKRFSELNIEEE